MRIRESKDGVELRLVRVIYDKKRKLEEKKDPKREVTLGRIIAACGPDEVDLHLRLRPGCQLFPHERAQLVDRLKGSLSAPELDGGSVIETLRELLGQLRHMIGDAMWRVRAVCRPKEASASSQAQLAAPRARLSRISRETAAVRRSGIESARVHMGEFRQTIGDEVRSVRAACGPKEPRSSSHLQLSVSRTSHSDPSREAAVTPRSAEVQRTKVSRLSVLVKPVRELVQRWLQFAARALASLLDRR